MMETCPKTTWSGKPAEAGIKEPAAGCGASWAAGPLIPRHRERAAGQDGNDAAFWFDVHKRRHRIESALKRSSKPAEIHRAGRNDEREERPAPSQGAPKSVERKAAECAENVFNVPLCCQHQDSPHIQNNDTKIKSRTMWRSRASEHSLKTAGICNILITADEYIVSVFGIIVNSPLTSLGKRRAHRQHKKGSMPLMQTPPDIQRVTYGAGYEKSVLICSHQPGVGNS